MKKAIAALAAVIVIAMAQPASAWTFNVETSKECREGRTWHTVKVNNPENQDAAVTIKEAGVVVEQLTAPAHASAKSVGILDAGTYWVKVTWPGDSNQPAKKIVLTDLEDCVPVTTTEAPTTTVAPTTTAAPEVEGTVVERGPESEQLAHTGFGEVLLWVIGGIVLIVVGKKLVTAARKP